MAVVGIDLGTSNSLICYWDGHAAVVIPNEYGQHLTPSVVGVDEEDQILVGAIAKERLISHPTLTVATFKRFMGTDKKYRLGKQRLTPVELSAFVLKSLLKNAEDYLGEKIQEAVISVPAYFNNHQREATQQAASLAGLLTVHLVSEPTAAAMAYGLHQKDDQTIMVLDLGGGTYDVSLLEMFEGVIQVEGISGDNQLGGEDFTQVLINDFLRKNDFKNVLPRPAERSIIYDNMERIKHKLSTSNEAEIAFTLGEELYHYKLTDKDYYYLCGHLFEKLRAPIARVLNDGKIQLEDLDGVILVGGATKSPLIRQYIAKLTHQFPYTHLEPDETIGLGAAIYASARVGDISKQEMILTDVCGFTLGVAIAEERNNEYIGGIFSPIIPRNTTIPVSREHTYYSIYPNQPVIEFKIYQGENLNVEENLLIGQLEIDIPPAPANYAVNCRFTYDVNGILEVIVTDCQTKLSERVVIQNSPTELSPAEIEESLKKLEKIKIHPKERAENQLMLAQLNRLYAEGTLKEKDFYKEIILDFRDVLERQDEAEIQETVQRLTYLIHESGRR